MSFSNTLESEVTPVGLVWRYIKENYPGISLYQADGSRPFTLLVKFRQEILVAPMSTR
ncbi:hypothetical protein [Flavobacterium sp. TBRC 19031]|uniref:hypothetical protein n=1 Tax=Flavobacterium mekongense TaxID=3379707 RepID=UPI00399B8E08